MTDYLGKDTFKLGFGLMRLPKLPDGSFDMPQICEMTDRFLAAGGTYFDTAYVYDNGKSEEAARAALVERYPRERFTLCTKMNAWLGKPSAEETKKQLETSLARTGAGYFDYYLLHAIQTDNREIYDSYGLWDFIRAQKEKGILRHIGFSYHADPKMLDELLSLHPEVDLVQLQINYADWENPHIMARENYEVARAHGVPVTIMEPVKGGALADPIDKVKAIFDKEDAGVSYASWAIRFAASLPGIITVLSGMSNLAQVDDNLSYMKEFRPLNDKEREVIRRVQEALQEDKSIACTACHYCTDGCPMEIPIPEIFKVKKRQANHASRSKAREEYAAAVKEKGKASDCIACGQCEGACPQHLPIIRLLSECAGEFE